MSVNEVNELNRLNFEDLLWIIFALLCFANVYGDDLQKKYVKSHLNNYEKKSNQVFTFILVVTLLIYILFFKKL